MLTGYIDNFINIVPNPFTGKEETTEKYFLDNTEIKENIPMLRRLDAKPIALRIIVLVVTPSSIYLIIVFYLK